MNQSFKLILFSVILLLISSCRDYENIPYQAPGTRQILLYSNDSLTINQTIPGNYINSDYYENTNNFMDSIRIDFFGATNIDTGNYSSIVIQANDESTNNIIKRFTFNTSEQVNQSYTVGFRVANIPSFITYFNLNLIINNVQSEPVYLRMKNIKVYNIY